VRPLKASVPGSSVIEAQFHSAPSGWQQMLASLRGVKSVQPEGADMYRLLTDDGSASTTALVEAAIHAKVQIKALTVQSTTLDDVFVHYTGRQLRDQMVNTVLYAPVVS
jgi:ABC-2 type transport system ATP-binding protein